MVADFPDELIVGLAQDWLSPREQRRFAATSKRFQRIIRQPLRIQICSIRNGGNLDCCCLAGELFATPATAGAEEAVKLVGYETCPRKPSLIPLDASSPLYYNQEYFLWRFDYQENCPVYLGRQLRQTQPPSLTEITNNDNNNANPRADYRFTLGFRPRTPNQWWKMLPETGGGVDDCSRDSNNNNNTNTKVSSCFSKKSAATVVNPRSPLQLVVSGWEDRPGQVESTELHKLTAQVRPTHSGRPIWAWHTVSFAVKDTQQESVTTDLSFAYTTSHLVRQQRPESELFVSFSSNADNRPMSSPGDRRRKRSHSGAVTQIYRLETFAIPDLSDRGAYLLYSPLRWRANLAPSTLLAQPGNSLIPGAASNSPHWFENGRIAAVEFSFWVNNGILYFKAYSLSFALAIPVVKLDREFFDPSLDPKQQHPEAQPIINLFESYSARWGCIKYYMATAADVGEGCAFNLDIFLRGVTDHEDHQVEQTENVIAIKMKEASTVVDPSLVTDVPRDDSRIWKFFFSW